MSGFFSRSSSKRRYPNPNMGGSHYRKKGLFGMLSGFGSGSGSHSYKNYYGQGGQNPGYSNQRYPNQGYPTYSNNFEGHGSFQSTSPAQTGQMNCPKCGAGVPAGSKFCLSCGEKLEANAVFCTSCGQPLPPGAKFCSRCGAPQS